MAALDALWGMKSSRGQLDGEEATARIVGTNGNDVLRGTNHKDVIIGKGGKDKLIGRGGNDTLKGGSGNDTLKGGSGNDTLKGGKSKGLGYDKLLGQSGNDKLKGGPGDDWLDGGKGLDKFWGGDGQDLFVFHRGDGYFRANNTFDDEIRDFQNGLDYIGAYDYDPGHNDIVPNHVDAHGQIGTWISYGPLANSGFIFVWGAGSFITDDGPEGLLW